MANQNDIFKSTFTNSIKHRKVIVVKYSGFFIKTSRGGGTLSRWGSVISAHYLATDISVLIKLCSWNRHKTILNEWKESMRRVIQSNKVINYND